MAIVRPIRLRDSELAPRDITEPTNEPVAPAPAATPSPVAGRSYATTSPGVYELINAREIAAALGATVDPREVADALMSRRYGRPSADAAAFTSALSRGVDPFRWTDSHPPASRSGPTSSPPPSAMSYEDVRRILHTALMDTQIRVEEQALGVTTDDLGFASTADLLQDEE